MPIVLRQDELFNGRCVGIAVIDPGRQPSMALTPQNHTNHLLDSFPASSVSTPRPFLVMVRDVTYDEPPAPHEQRP